MLAFLALLFNRKVIYNVRLADTDFVAAQWSASRRVERWFLSMNYVSACKQEDKENDESSPTISQSKTADYII